MTYYTTEEDAKDELSYRPHLKTGETLCACGETPCYYEYSIHSQNYDRVTICDHCYLNCANFERI